MFKYEGIKSESSRWKPDTTLLNEKREKKAFLKGNRISEETFPFNNFHEMHPFQKLNGIFPISFLVF